MSHRSRRCLFRIHRKQLVILILWRGSICCLIIVRICIRILQMVETKMDFSRNVIAQWVALTHFMPAIHSILPQKGRFQALEWSCEQKPNGARHSNLFLNTVVNPRLIVGVCVHEPKETSSIDLPWHQVPPSALKVLGATNANILSLWLTQTDRI